MGGGLGLPDVPQEVQEVAVDQLAAVDRHAATDHLADDGHLHRVSVASGPLPISPALVSERKAQLF